MTVNRPFVLESAPVWLNLNNFARKSGSKLHHRDVKDSLPVLDGSSCSHGWNNQLLVLGAITFPHMAR